jgi:hypothetical protein
MATFLRDAGKVYIYIRLGGSRDGCNFQNSAAREAHPRGGEENLVSYFPFLSVFPLFLLFMCVPCNLLTSAHGATTSPERAFPVGATNPKGLGSVESPNCIWVPLGGAARGQLD